MKRICQDIPKKKCDPAILNSGCGFAPLAFRSQYAESRFSHGSSGNYAKETVAALADRREAFEKLL